jgi:hypothetical protein
MEKEMLSDHLQTEKLPSDLKAAIKKSILGYLHDKDEAMQYMITKNQEAQTDGSVLKGKFISCTIGKMTLPCGTPGWLFEQPAYEYSKYIEQWGISYPAKDAEKVLIGIHYTWVTLVKLETGDETLAHLYKYVDLGEK